MSSESSGPFLVEAADGVAFVKLTDNQVSNVTRDALYALCDRVAQTPEPRCVALDLSNVRVLNSTAIGVLINFQKRLRDVRASLKLCCVDPFVLDLFRLTKMDQVIDIRSDRADVIDAFHARSRGGGGGSGSKPAGNGGKEKGWLGRLFGGK